MFYWWEFVYVDAFVKNLKEDSVKSRSLESLFESETVYKLRTVGK
jgi:hypothetical protein